MIISEGKVKNITPPVLGVLVATVAVILGGVPLIARAYLRGTIPAVWVPEGVERKAKTPTQFLETKRDSAFKKAMALATQLDSSTAEPSKRRSSYREAVMALNLVDLKLTDSFNAMVAERAWPLEQVVQHEHARRLIERRAQSLNKMVMAYFTLAMLVFMYFVRASGKTPQWAKEVSWIGAGAVLVGWVPL